MRPSACSAFAAPLSCPALLARFEKADALLPSAARRFGLRLCALLARLAKASELFAITAKTFGSALSALIALLSAASCWNATALLAMLAFDAALDAAFWNEFALFA